MDKIPFLETYVDPTRIAEVLRAFQDVPANEIVRSFETQLSEYLGGRKVVALNSGTSAIHLALKLLGVGKGDSVVCPTFTYVASASPILYLGAEPVFIDSEPETWNMDPELLRKALKELKNRPKAIIVVDAYGEMPKMDELEAIANEFEIPLIEDSAEAIGSEYKGKKGGNFGDVGILSFNNNKTITGFGGGALLTDNPDFIEKAKMWSAHSRIDKPYYLHEEIGYNYMMSPLNAAYLIGEFEDIDEKIRRKTRIFANYCKALKELNVTFSCNDHSFNNRWIPSFTFPETKPDKILSVIGQVNKEGIEIRPVWKPLHQQPLFKTNKYFLNGTTDLLFNNSICLPSSLSLNDRNLDNIARVVKKCINV